MESNEMISLLSQILDERIGMVTAYAYAKSKGYSGSADDFANDMANIGVNISAIETAINTFNNQTVPNAETAITTAGSNQVTAVNTAGQEQLQNVTAEGGRQVGLVAAAGTAQTEAVNTAGTTQTAAVNNAGSTQVSNVNNAGSQQITAIQQKGEETKQSIPSDYTELSDSVEDLKTATSQILNDPQPTMSVGNVFSDDSYTEDKTPYLYRVSGGGVEVGKVEADKIVGGTVAWNQLSKTETSAYNPNVGTRSYDSSTNTFTVTNSEPASWLGVYSTSSNIIATANHKYLLLVKATNTLATNLMFGTETSYKIQSGFTANTEKECATVINPTTRNAFIFYFANASSVKFRDIQIFDLTQMFGSAVADMIYAMETANAGAGVAFFRKMFPNDYYEYNAGELKSVSGLQSHDMVGFNQFDEDSAKWIADYYITANGGQGSSSSYRNTSTYIRVRPNTTYAYRVYKTSTATTSLSVAFYDADKNFISRSTPSTETTQIGVNTAVFTTPVNACYARLNAPTNSKDICINISSDRNGEYEPYEKHSYPLDSTLTLMGIPKVADGKMYYDGDVYSADGKVTRKYGVVDLGTLTWEAWTGYAGVYRTSLPSNCKTMPNNTLPNWVAPIYKTVIGTDVSSNNKTIGQLHQTYIVVHDDSYSDTATFKTAMSGVMLVYELATPTEEAAQAYTEYQKVSKYGTEEYVSTSIVPVGHITKYPTDIVSKVDGLPSDFSTLIAPTESAFKATRAYTVNELIIIDNVLYKVTASIASGATITPNTNVQQTTLSALIKALSA